jgi:glycosyltransferase involved in cell wall biosynthesis
MGESADPVRDEIAVNAAILGDRPTGLGTFSIHLVEALATLGERLRVYTARPEAIRGLGVRVDRIWDSVRPELGARGHVARLLWVQIGLRRALRQRRPGVLLNLMPEGLIAPAVPQVAIVYDLLPLRYPAEYPRQQYYFRRLVPRVLRHCQAVVTISEATQRDMRQFYGVATEKIHIALCGYDRRRFTPEGPATSDYGGEPYGLYVGNIMPHKNLLRLVDAFSAVAPRTPARLVIRGWGRAPHVEALRRRIAERGLGDRVDWQPWAELEALPALYRGARMLLLPSLAEGFGLTALEAMACGTPVLTSNCSSMPEVVGDAALLVDPLDTASVTDALGRLFADDRLVKDLAARGVERASQFSWERTARAVQGALRAAQATSR